MKSAATRELALQGRGEIELWEAKENEVLGGLGHSVKAMR